MTVVYMRAGQLRKFFGVISPKTKFYSKRKLLSTQFKVGQTRQKSNLILYYIKTNLYTHISIQYLKRKIEVPRDVRNSKSGNMKYSGENGLNIRANTSPKFDRNRFPEE